MCQQLGRGAPHRLHPAELVGAGAGAARIADVLLAHVDFDHIARQLAAGAPQVDLEGERVLARPGIEHPLQRRVGDDAAVPVELAVDLGGGKARRQRAAGHDMGGGDLVRLVVEIGEVAGPDVGGADAEAGLARIDPVEIHQALEQRLERRDVVEAEVPGIAGRREDRRRKARLEEAGCAHQHDAQGAPLVHDLVLHVVLDREARHVGDAEGRGRHRLPEGAQLLDPLLRRIAGDQRRIDGADRDAGDPVRVEIGLGQRLVGTGLIGAQRAAALEEERDALEFGARCGLGIHGVSPSQRNRRGDDF